MRFGTVKETVKEGRGAKILEIDRANENGWSAKNLKKEKEGVDASLRECKLRRAL